MCCTWTCVTIGYMCYQRYTCSDIFIQQFKFYSWFGFRTFVKTHPIRIFLWSCRPHRQTIPYNNSNRSDWGFFSGENSDFSWVQSWKKSNSTDHGFFFDAEHFLFFIRKYLKIVNRHINRRKKFDKYSKLICRWLEMLIWMSTKLRSQSKRFSTFSALIGCWSQMGT